MEENEVKVVEEETNSKGKKKKPFDLTVKIYKIVSLIIYLLWTAFWAYILISARIDAESGDSGKVLGYIFVILIMVAVGLIGYGIMTIISISGLSLAIANKHNPKRKFNIIFFAIEIVLSVGTFFALLYLTTATYK